MTIRSRRRLALPTLTATALLAACGGAPEDRGGGPAAPASSPAPATSSGPPASGDDGHEWGYAGDHGPEHWGALPGAEACGSGHAQSPVDLAGARATDLPDVQVDYRTGVTGVVDTGHTVRADVAPGSVATIEGREYGLRQIHHHTPSEHTVDGASADGELHLVHEDEEGRAAVLGVLLTEGEANPAVQAFLDAAPEDEGATATPRGSALDPTALLPAQRGSFRYDGSLTTPPCTEGVRWTVFAEPLTASAEQLAALERLSGENSRPVQALGERALRHDEN